MMAMPDFLTGLPRWVLWRNVTRGNRVTKLPISMRGSAASSTNPNDWSSYAEISAAMVRTPGAWDGPGIVLGDLGNGEVLSGIDLDSCLVDGAISEWAKPFLRTLPTYAEVSPSGSGLKLFFRAKAADLAGARRVLALRDDEGGRKKTFGASANGHPPAAELYLSGRYFTVTGQQWIDSPDEVSLISEQSFAALAALFGSRERQDGSGIPVADATAPNGPALRHKLAQAMGRSARLADRWLGGMDRLEDQSRSGYDMSLGAMLKRAGMSYSEMRQCLMWSGHGAGAERATEGDERYFERIWARSVVDAPAPEDPPAVSEAFDPETGEILPPEEAPQLPVVYFNEVRPNLDAADFVEDMLIDASMSVVYGQSNSGKTFWTSNVGLHVAAGMAWNGRAIERRGVLWLAMEGSHGIFNRVSAWREHHDIDAADLPFVIIPVALNLLDPGADTDKLIQTVRAVRSRIAIPIGWTIVDTLSRAIAGGNENAPDDMGALVSNGTRIQQETKSALTWIHHSGKDEAKGARGHSLLRAATDTEIEITAEATRRMARVTKQRELDCAGEFPFTLRVVELGRNKRGKAVTSCVVEALGEGDTASAVLSPRVRGHAKRALEVLGNLLASAGRSGIAGTPSGVISVPDKWWKDRFFDEAMAGAEAEAKRKAFRRAADDLIEFNIVAMRAGRVWLVQRTRAEPPSHDPDTGDTE